MPAGGCRTPSEFTSASKRWRSSATSIASGEVPRIGTPAASSPLRELERRLAAELHDHAERLLEVDDLQHILERQRLEVERVGDVEVGGDGLRIRVDHHRAIAELAEGERRADAAVVELDALPDAIRARTEDDHRLARLVRARPALVLLVPAGVEIRRARRELTGTGVHRLVDRAEAEAMPRGARRRLRPVALRSASCQSEKPDALHPEHAWRGRRRRWRRTDARSTRLRIATSSAADAGTTGRSPRPRASPRPMTLAISARLTWKRRSGVGRRIAAQQRLAIDRVEAVVDRAGADRPSRRGPSRGRGSPSAAPP